MTAPRNDDLAEREVDLARWRRALVALWWIPVAGLVLGAIVGVLFSFRGGTAYKAAALISLGAPVSPGGVADLELRHEPAGCLRRSSARPPRRRPPSTPPGSAPARCAGKVSVAQVGTATGAGATRAAPLISLTVQGHDAKKTQLAANALAARRRRADDSALRRDEDQRRTPRSSRRRTASSHRSASGSLRSTRRVKDSHLAAARPARADQPDRQRRAAPGKPLRPEGDDPAAARVRARTSRARR